MSGLDPDNMQLQLDDGSLPGALIRQAITDGALAAVKSDDAPRDDVVARLAELRDRWVELRQTEHDERKFNPSLHPHDPHSGQWMGSGGALGLLEKVAPKHRHITPDEARGNSRPVSVDEFNTLADRGKAMLDHMRANSSPTTGLDRNWDALKGSTYGEVRKSWGGATIDAHTGVPLLSTADRYALSVKPEGMATVSIPESASRQEFDRAMEQARTKFRPLLEHQSSYLGVFHDDDNNRIDIDPVVVVNTPDEVEAIGAYTHAIGGAYHFASGDGYFPPHVAEPAPVRSIALGDKVHWKGPGQWRSYAESVQRKNRADTG